MDIFCSELLPPVSRSSSHHQTTFQHSSYRQHLSALLEKPARPTYAVFWCWSTLFIPAGRCGGLLGDSEVSWGSMWNHVLYWVHHEEQETTDPVTFNVKSVASRQQHTSLKHWYTPARGSQRCKYLSKQQIQYTDPSAALSTARHKNPVSCWLLTPYWWIHSGQNGCKKKLQLSVHTSLR